MRPLHIFFAILVMAIWGFSFVTMEVGLRDMPPLLLCGSRFLFASIPAVFFIKRPVMPLKMVALYGFLMFAASFSFAFFGIRAGVSPGLVSLLVQLQIFFTILLAVLFLQESVNKWQIMGAIIAVGGLGIVGMHIGGNITILGLLFILAAAFCWSVANIIIKQAGNVNILALTVWGGLFAWPPLFLLSFIIEGPSKVLQSFQHLNLLAAASILYMAYPATLIGFLGWGWLLKTYRTATVTPFALLIPVFGILSSVIFLHEPFQTWKITAAMLILAGLCVNIIGPRVFK